MSIDKRALAFRRFGLGARPGDLDKPAGDDVVAALIADVAAATAPGALASLSDSPSLFKALVEMRAEKKAMLAEAPRPAPMTMDDMVKQGAMAARAARPGQAAPGMAMTGPVVPASPMAAPPPPVPPNPTQEAVTAELGARLTLARAVDIGFGERLALFWSNHFTVSGADQKVHIMAGAFEREAIRPHLTGRFHDMLAAAESHPAMLLYLNNERSMGPNSQAGKRQSKGLNENLAREILELHTVGVDGGYTQADVTAFARAITGWSIIGPQGNDGTPGTFIYRRAMHEPGAQHIVGHDYPQDGIDQGMDVLTDLAHHPNTAKHIAFKLVRHFIADVPPPAAVVAVAAAFQRSDGDLNAVHEALLRTDAAFDAPAQKLRPPVEFVLASTRALQANIEPQQFQRALTLLGQRPFMAPSPQGWSDDSKAWLAPDAIRTRLEFANLLSLKVGGSRPVERARAVLGPLMTEETQSTIERAETTEQALALLLMSPEFQRR